MSYDLYACRFPDGLSTDELMRLLEEGDPEEHELPLSSQDIADVADALMAVEPTAQRHDGAAFVQIDADTLDVLVEPTGATVTIPYHGDAESAAATMDRAFRYAEALTAAGLTVWDPQTGSLVGDGHDPASAARMFAGTSERVREMALADHAPAKRSRWAFWRR